MRLLGRVTVRTRKEYDYQKSVPARLSCEDGKQKSGGGGGCQVIRTIERKQKRTQRKRKTKISMGWLYGEVKCHAHDLSLIHI